MNNRVINFLESEYLSYTKKEISKNYIYKNSEEHYYIIKENEIVYSDYSALIKAIYHLISFEQGISFSHFESFSFPNQKLIFDKKYSASFTRRGNSIETIDDINYLKNLIDWMGKNGANELFFTFEVWDKVKKDIENDLLNRNIKVTLGGHSLQYLLKTNDLNVNDFSFLKNENLFSIIENYCSHPSVYRISLWPEDVGIKDKNIDEFFNDYLVFSDKLQEYLPNIIVEHIAYNAGLNMDMLRFTDLHKPHLNTLFAYWGRDYSESFSNVDEEVQSSLKMWNKSASSTTVFEYYSDFYMMSELFPPLGFRIYEDVRFFKNMNIDGLINLFFEPEKSMSFELIKDKLNIKWIHLYNDFMLSSATWNTDIEDAQDEWFYSYGDESLKIKELYNKLEVHLSHFSQYNKVYFNKRFVDDHYNLEDAHNHLLSIIDLIDNTILSLDLSNSFNKETILYLEVLQEVAIYFSSYKAK